MYLKNLFIENAGAIEKISLVEEDIFHEELPKPIILLGKNGTGKTTLMSCIVDALYELSSQCFIDVLPMNGTNRKYFKLAGSGNIKTDAQYYFSYINFQSASQEMKYFDGAGDFSDFSIQKATNYIISDFVHDFKGKHVSRLQNKKEFEQDFIRNSYCYFPSDRFEMPYWINKDAAKGLEQFKEVEYFSGNLNRDIVVRSSLDQIKSWVLDVFLDSRADLLFNGNNITLQQPASDLLLLQTSVKNIENLISQIVQKPIRLDLNLRGLNRSRIKLIDTATNKEYIPSLDNLSAGQSTLLSIFATIIQYSDQADPHKSIRLHEIEGIVIIDEIDLHLHIELQQKVLPQLIKLFPKVQFIISTHSPFFLLGMSETFKLDEYLMVNMPDGDIITDTSRFEEFQKAYDLFIDINDNYKKQFDFLKERISNNEKPLIITEGKTDWKHLKTAFNKLCPKLSIEFLEYEDELDMGDKALKGWAEKLKFMPNNRKIICIFDRDNPEIVKTYGKQEYCDLGNDVYAFCLPKISDELDNISIEFYYKNEDLKKMDGSGRRLFVGDEFYEKSVNSKCGCYQTVKTDKTGKLVILDKEVYCSNDAAMENSIALSKSDFSEYVYHQEKPFDEMDFEHFDLIINIIKKIIQPV